MCNAVSFFTFHVIPLYSVLFHLSCRVFIFILKGFSDHNDLAHVEKGNLFAQLDILRGLVELQVLDPI